MATFSNAISWSAISEIKIYEVIYVLSISFQLAAGLLLLTGNAKTSKKAIVSKFCTQHRAINVYPDGTMRDYEEFVEVARVVWINKMAFIYLVAGYLLSVFGDTPERKWIAFGIIIGVSSVIIDLSCKFAKHKSYKYGIVDFNEFILDKSVMTIEVSFPQENNPEN